MSTESCSLRAFLREPTCGTCKKDQTSIRLQNYWSQSNTFWTIYPSLLAVSIFSWLADKWRKKVSWFQLAWLAHKWRKKISWFFFTWLAHKRRKKISWFQLTWLAHKRRKKVKYCLNGPRLSYKNSWNLFQWCTIMPYGWCSFESKWSNSIYWRCTNKNYSVLGKIMTKKINLSIFTIQ